jgi:hypothetical protein
MNSSTTASWQKSARADLGLGAAQALAQRGGVVLADGGRTARLQRGENRLHLLAHELA